MAVRPSTRHIQTRFPLGGPPNFTLQASAAATGTLAFRPHFVLTGSSAATATMAFTVQAVTNIQIYTGSPTSAGTNGTRVTSASPISSGQMSTGTGSEVACSPIKLAVRAASGKSRNGSFPIRIRGGGATVQWALAPDSAGSPGTWGAWGDSLYLAGPIGDTNTIFWAKARVTTDESTLMFNNRRDRSVVIRIPTDAV